MGLGSSGTGGVGMMSGNRCGLGEVLLYVGLALALIASALYLRTGLAQLRSSPDP